MVTSGSFMAAVPVGGGPHVKGRPTTLPALDIGPDADHPFDLHERPGGDRAPTHVAILTLPLPLPLRLTLSLSLFL